MDFPVIRHTVAKRMLSFSIVMYHKYHSFSKISYSCACHVATLSNVNFILFFFGIKYHDIFTEAGIFKTKTHYMEGDENWQVCMMREILNISDGQMDCHLTYDARRELLDDICSYILVRV